MTASDRLAPGVQEFIESMGVYFERFKMPRVVGRMLGLLMVAEQPLSLDDLAALLQVSRASASTNIRLAMNYGIAEMVGVPGDRRDYYRLTADPWERHLAHNVTATAALQRIADGGLAALSPDDRIAQSRLQEMRDFCDVSLDALYTLMERWRACREGRTVPRPAHDAARTHRF